jgi:Kef-type K+ transport system membrane component KefB/Trk K+ transport system NAD-binding subunit
LLKLLAELGFVFLMFLSGMEIDFSVLGAARSSRTDEQGQRWGPITLGSLSFGVTLVLSGLAGYGLWQLHLVHNPWMMALILSTTSLGIVVPVLKEAGLTSGRYGQTLLIAALIADFVTMLLITVVIAMLSGGTTARILYIGLLFGVVFLLYRLGIVINKIKAVRHTLEELSHATAQIKLRAAFAMMLVVVALSDVLGVEMILGAFLAGAIVAFLRNPQDEMLSHQLEGIGFGFFIPIFFIMVGVKFNLPALFASRATLWLLPLLLSAAVVIKLVSGLIFRLGFSWRETLGAGVLLSARLSLIIAAAAIGRELDIISESVNAAIILVAIVTVTATPPVFLKLVPARSHSRPRPIIVVGAGELGLQVAEQLRGHREPVIVVDADPSRLERAQQHGFVTVRAGADHREPDLAPYLENAQSLICTYNDSTMNYRICEFVRAHYAIDNLVTQVAEPRELKRFQALGVTTMNAALDRAAILAVLARNPAAYALLSRTDDDKEVREVALRSGQHVGKLVRELRLPGDVLLVAIRREGELLVPHGSTRLENGDRLTLVGSLDSVHAARAMFI